MDSTPALEQCTCYLCVMVCWGIMGVCSTSLHMLCGFDVSLREAHWEYVEPGVLLQAILMRACVHILGQHLD